MSIEEAFLRGFAAAVILIGFFGMLMIKKLVKDVKDDAVENGHAFYSVTEKGEVEFKWLPACRKNP